MPQLPNYLPGRFDFSRGSAREYGELARFHYLAGRPASFSQVWVVRYGNNPLRTWRVVAVGVLSYPPGNCFSRRAALGITGPARDELQFANQHIRTISRVIVHPQFRALGLSSLLVRTLCRECPTRYVEAMAVMGRAHPFFERAGMKRFEPAEADRPVYYWFDKHVGNSEANIEHSTHNIEC